MHKNYILLYFLAFGSKARIITPEYLGKSIYKSYKGYTDNYEKNETKHIYFKKSRTKLPCFNTKIIDFYHSLIKSYK